MVLDKNSEYKEFRKKNGILSIVFSRNFFVILFFIIQLIIIGCLINAFGNDVDKIVLFYIILMILNFFVVIYIVNKRKIKDSYKVTWIIFMQFFPIFGLFFFIIINSAKYFDKHNKKLHDLLHISRLHVKSDLKNLDAAFDDIRKDESKDSDYVNAQLYVENSLSNYIDKTMNFAMYQNTAVKYFKEGKDAFEDILDKLKEAKKFIFIEIFILSNGIIWQEMLKILKEKINEGVEVRLMYDGLNTISSLSPNYDKELEAMGFKVKVFKKPMPVFTNSQNNRDHRKIFVIDNEIAYTGGINIADEYANLYERFGYWKDVAARFTGNAVESFTLMFLQVWDSFNESDLHDDFPNYLKPYSGVPAEYHNGIVVPFSDYPTEEENISVQMIKYMLNVASTRMYIMTPYLVIDELMLDALESAAKRGVDVRIIVPHIPDKKYVYLVNRSYYKSLALSGVRVYEYTPGFIHAKVYYQDDIRAIVGTINLDFRSLYLHTENGAYVFSDDPFLKDIKDDFNELFKICKEMTIDEITKIPLIQRILGGILKMFAPLM